MLNQYNILFINVDNMGHRFSKPHIKKGKYVPHDWMPMVGEIVMIEEVGIEDMYSHQIVDEEDWKRIKNDPNIITVSLYFLTAYSKNSRKLIF
jgi:hypothetical protein